MIRIRSPGPVLLLRVRMVAVRFLCTLMLATCNILYTLALREPCARLSLAPAMIRIRLPSPVRVLCVLMAATRNGSYALALSFVIPARTNACHQQWFLPALCGHARAYACLFAMIRMRSPRPERFACVCLGWISVMYRIRSIRPV